MKNMGTITAVCALALMLGAVGWAQPGKHGENGSKSPGLIQQADANKDGKVTFEELKAVRPKMTQERFKQLDTSGDGVLDKNDRPQGAQGHQGPAAFLALLKAADANKDGKVTYEEAKAVRPKMTEERFKSLDKDKDGVLTKADAPKEAPDATGKPGAQLKAADVNNDGKVTFDELKAVRPNLTQDEFKKLDRNGDGVITQADRKQPS